MACWHGAILRQPQAAQPVRCRPGPQLLAVHALLDQFGGLLQVGQVGIESGQLRCDGCTAQLLFGTAGDLLEPVARVTALSFGQKTEHQRIFCSIFPQQRMQRQQTLSVAFKQRAITQCDQISG